jgi:ubiquinone biosynthesis UbiH/UbiF/VisC/COQ6 family hydroxylase
MISARRSDLLRNHVIIIGGGPAGLALAGRLSQTAARVTIVERQPIDALADPAPDGRDIALTHRSVDMLRELGAWPRIPRDEIHPLRAARVLNGRSLLALSFAPDAADTDRLGYLVSNHVIRRALFEALADQPRLDWHCGASVAEIDARRDNVRVVLADGTQLAGDLIVGADSRFSFVRDQLGIAAECTRLGKSMLVCRVTHEIDHGGVATEWFDHGQTVALLPLGEGQSSAVVTLADGAAKEVAALSLDRLGEELTRRFHRRFGTMRAISPIHVYPLTVTWSRHFAATRAALVGDAAVGMHPVTAHGFNLGLSGVDRLGGLLAATIARGRDVGDPLPLRRFEAGHRAATLPLYRATNMIVRLFTDDRPLARAARDMTIGLGVRLPPVRHAVSAMLAQHAPTSRWPRFPLLPRPR